MPFNHNINGNSIIELHNIEIFTDDNDFVTARRIGTSDYISLDTDALKLYRCFGLKRSILEVTKLNAELEYTLQDILEFVEVLINAEFVKTIDGVEISESLNDEPREQVRTNKLIRILFSKIAWIVYFLSAIANVVLFYSYDHLHPRGSDLFVSSSGIVSIIVIILCTWIAIFFHEFGHICAAINVGIDAKIKWGYRLVFLVLETQVSDIWSVPRNRRYGVYLAGLAWTSILVLICTTLQFFIETPIIVKVLKFTVIMQLQTIVFQALLFLRTDLYYVVTNSMKIDNLNEQTLFLFKNLVTLKFEKIKTKLNERFAGVCQEFCVNSVIQSLVLDLTWSLWRA